MRSNGAHRRALQSAERGALGKDDAGYANSQGPQTDSGRGVRAASSGLRSSWTVAIAATVAVTGSLLFVAWAKMQTVQYTYQIDALIDSEEELAGRQRALRSELAQLRAPARLHQLASELGLAPPAPGHVVVVTSDPEGLNEALAGEPDLPAERQAGAANSDSLSSSRGAP